MKKFSVIFAVLFLLSGCSSLGIKSFCDGQSLARPSFFDQGEYLAAFKMTLQARGQMLESLLQIKKTAAEEYEAVLYAAAGGYKLMQARINKDGVKFVFITPQADVPIVREKAESFLTLLLFPPEHYKHCRDKDGTRTVTYGGGLQVHYQYLPGQEYPRGLTYRKKFGTARLNFGQYTPYEQGLVPHYLYYSDGSAEADLILLTLKKE